MRRLQKQLGITFADAPHRPGIVDQPIEEIARYLLLRLGAELTGFAVGAPPAEIVELAEGRGDAAPDVDRRMRNVYAVAYLIATRDGPGTAYRFLVERQPELDDRPPAELLRAGEAPESVWFAAVGAF